MGLNKSYLSIFLQLFLYKAPNALRFMAASVSRLVYSILSVGFVLCSIWHKKN